MGEYFTFKIDFELRMKKFLCFLFGVSVLFVTKAQDNEDPSALALAIRTEANTVYPLSVFLKEVGSLTKIFVDSTNVRNSPSLDGEIIASLPQNTSVKIIADTEIVSQIQERTAKWYEIEFDNYKKGYVWAANLAIQEIKMNNKNLLFGINGTQYEMLNGFSEPYLVGEVKLLVNNELKDQHTFNAGGKANMSGTVFEIQEAVRLKDVSSIVLTSVSGEACGIPTYSQYYFVVNDKLVALPKLTSVADAAIFYESEEFFFPQKGNKMTNQFVLETEKAEYINPDAKVLKKNGSTITKIFSWDGVEYKETSSTEKTFKNKVEEMY